METPVNIIVHSHLSDAMIEMGFDQELATTRIQFVKYLISSFRMDDEIEIDEVWKLWIAGRK